jgi:ABC-type ATPase involved in cell division
MTMSNAESILEFHAVAYAGDADYEPVRDVTFALAPGECVLVQVDSVDRQLPLAELACGVLEPSDGAVRFEGKDWNRYGPNAASSARGRIHRIFQGKAWLNNLDVDENIVLAMQYHRKGSLRKLRREAEEMAQRLGLPELPGGRPAWTDVRQLQRAQWVRALLGQPDLLVFEHAAHHLPPRNLPTFMKVLEEERAGGAAVLWIGQGRAFEIADSTAPDRVYNIGDWEAGSTGEDSE